MDMVKSKVQIQSYRTKIDSLYDRAIPTFVANGCAEDASVILGEMVSRAKISFYAYAHKMSKEVWNDDILLALQDANARNVSVRLLVDQECEALSADRLPHCLRTLVRCRTGANRDDIGHFAVADARAVRLETNCEKREAWFSANSPRVAKEMQGAFRKLFLMGEVCGGVHA